MRTSSQSRLPEHVTLDQQVDPREAQGAEIIDLATRTVLPTVSQRKRSDGAGLALGIGIVALLGAATLYGLNAARQDTSAPAGADSKMGPLPPTAVTQVAAPATGHPQAAAAQPSLPAPAPSAVLAAPPQVATAISPVTNPNATPAVVFDASALPLPISGPGDGKEASTGNANEDFAARIGGGTGSKATASRSFDPRTTVTQGTLIPAVLETAIDTDVPGFVRAVISTDVRSFDGARVLIPRSSRLIGQYKSGVQAGQKRAYVIWTRVIRPDGVTVNIASPAIGFGGETGLAGKVNSHFFERFGSAMLLSIVGGLSSITGSSSVVIAGGGQSAAAAAVSQSGQIGPTIRVRQGEPIRVFTAKDLDFSRVS